jgi:hypothetical protein
MSISLQLKKGPEFEVHSAPERGCGASIWAAHFVDPAAFFAA